MPPVTLWWGRKYSTRSGLVAARRPSWYAWNAFWTRMSTTSAALVVFCQLGGHPHDV